MKPSPQSSLVYTYEIYLTFKSPTHSRISYSVSLKQSTSSFQGKRWASLQLGQRSWATAHIYRTHPGIFQTLILKQMSLLQKGCSHFSILSKTQKNKCKVLKRWCHRLSWTQKIWYGTKNPRRGIWRPGSFSGLYHLFNVEPGEVISVSDFSCPSFHPLIFPINHHLSIPVCSLNLNPESLFVQYRLR